MDPPPRNNQQTNFINIEHQNEIKEIEAHYEELMKMKEDRFIRCHEKLNNFEKENETLKSEKEELEEEKKKMKINLIECENKRSQAESENDKLTKKYNDLQKTFESWSTFDIKAFFEGEEINKELIQKRLTFDHFQERFLNGNIKIQQERIKLLEAEILYFTKNSKQETPESGSLMNRYFGGNYLKNEIKRLNDENQRFKDREENMTKFFTIHELSIEELKNRIQELEEQLKTKSENILSVNFQENNFKLEEANIIIRKKDDALIKMRERIDQLVTENKNLEMNKEVDDKKWNTKIRTLDGKYNSLQMEYDQMTMKYENAKTEIETLTKEISTHIAQLHSSSSLEIEKNQLTMTTSKPPFQSPVPTNVWSRERNFSNEQYITPNSTKKNQVFEQSTDITVCPNCSLSLPSDEIDQHFEICIEEYC